MKKVKLSEHEFDILIDSLWMVTSIKLPKKDIDERLELSLKLRKAYDAGVGRIEIDTTALRGLAKEIAEEFKGKKHLSKDQRKLAKTLGIQL